MKARDPERVIFAPWYRSALVWLGLFPLSFLLWAWRDSMATGRGVMWVRPGQSFVLSHGAGSLRLGEDEAQQKTTIGLSTWIWGFDPDEGQPTPFPRPSLEWQVEDSRTVWKIPHWLLAGLHVAIWVGGIRYRSIRIRRAGNFPVDA